MRLLITAICALATGASCVAQSAFSVIGTPIPPSLVKQNYGRVPKGIVAYDLNICNASAAKQSVISGEIYQALSQNSAALQPVGREIVFAAILQNRNRSIPSILTTALATAWTVYSAINSATRNGPSGLLTATTLLSVAGPQILSDLKPSRSASQLQQFESQVLEPALVLDAGACVERTIFAKPSSPKLKLQNLNFHVR